jgi:hypothetical protein
VIPTRPAGDTSSTLYYAEFEAMIREDPTCAKAYEALHQKGATQADIHPYVQYTLADVTTLPSTR